VNPKSHGTGQFELKHFRHLGKDVVFEPGVLVFHPENIEVHDRVYVGHYAILKGYYKNQMVIGAGTWIGQQCFFHSAGGLTIGQNVGLGPGVKIITSFHADEGIEIPILHSRVEFAPVIIEDDADIGVGATIMPGVTIGKGVQVGAGAVVTQTLPPYTIAVGIPARVLRTR
jgi:acetyltransferase-like isoleucine patch superfamily enzyme